MFRVSHAVLHSFDFEEGSLCLSQRELDLSERAVRSYVTRRMRSVTESPESRRGTFREGAALAASLAQLADGSLSLMDLSRQVAEYLFDELRYCDEAEQADLLVARYSDTGTLRDQAVRAEGEDDPGSEAPDARDLVGFVLLPRRKAFVHELDSDADGMADNQILRQDSALPNPTQKADTYVVVDLRSMAIEFRDRDRLSGGTARQVVAEGLLQCDATASSREAMEEVERIVGDVAEECGANPAVAVAHAKACMAEAAEEGESFSPGEVGSRIFEDQPRMRERYQEEARAADLPEEVPVRRGAANRMAKSHHIRTDTGIDITFPSAYAADTDHIEFTREADGSVRITIKNVGSIESR